MNLRKFISGVSALAIAASAFAAMTITASAEDTTISYTKNSASVGTVAFSPSGAGLGTYTATGIARGTLTIQYTIGAGYYAEGTTNGKKTKYNSRYRAGLKIGGKTIYVNATDANSKGNWGTGNEYHINFKPIVTNDTVVNSVTVKIVAAINAEGKATSLTVTPEYSKATVSATWSAIDLSSSPQDISSIEFKTADRDASGSNGYQDNDVTLSNFSATLAPYTQYSVGNITGGDYRAYSYDAEKDELTLGKYGGNNGASNAADAAEAAVNAGVTETYMASKVNTFTVTPNDDTIKKVTVTHSNSGKTAEIDSSNIVGTLTGSGSILFTIVATANAETKDGLLTKLNQLGSGYFEASVTVE